MPITFVGQGQYVSGKGDFLSVPTPFGVAVDDLLVVLMETQRDSPVTPSFQSFNWVQAPNSPVNNSLDSEGTRLTVYWRWADTSTNLFEGRNLGDHQAGRMMALRGVKKSDNPWEATAWAIGDELNTLTIPSITTLTPNALIFIAVTGAGNNNTLGALSNPNLSGIILRSHDAHGVENDGNQASATAYKITPGAIGPTTASINNDEEWAAWIGALVAEPGEDLPPDPGPGNQERFVYPVGIVSPIGNLIVELVRIDRELPYGTVPPIAFDTWQWDTPEPVIEDRDRIDYYLAWQMMDNTMESQPKKIDAIRLTAKANNPTIQIFAASPGEEISKEDLEAGSNARASVRFEDSEEVTRYERKKVKIKNLSIWTARYSGSWDGENEKDRLDELIIEGDIHGTTK